MSKAYAIVSGDYFKSGLLNILFQIAGIEHFTVTIGHSGKVEAGLSQTERSRLEALSIPKSFHDIEP